jgi:hypothetical protein
MPGSREERAGGGRAGGCGPQETGKRYVTAAVAAGLSREGGEEQLTDELIGQVVSVVRPVRPDGHGQGWAELAARREQITGWAEGGVPVVKIGILLGRQGVVVAERTLHRFAAERCGAAGSKVTTPVDDGPRTRPACRALDVRVAQVSDLAHAAAQRTSDSVLRAAEAHNLAALIVSDCGLPPWPGTCAGSSSRYSAPPGP